MSAIVLALPSVDMGSIAIHISQIGKDSLERIYKVIEKGTLAIINNPKQEIINLVASISYRTILLFGSGNKISYSFKVATISEFLENFLKNLANDGISDLLAAYPSLQDYRDLIIYPTKAVTTIITDRAVKKIIGKT